MSAAQEGPRSLGFYDALQRPGTGASIKQISLEGKRKTGQDAEPPTEGGCVCLGLWAPGGQCGGKHGLVLSVCLSLDGVYMVYSVYKCTYKSVCVQGMYVQAQCVYGYIDEYVGCI